MATRSAGRVTIRVIPDSTSFRRDLKVALDRIENTQTVTIPAHLTVTRESVAKLKEQLRDLEVKIKVEPVVTQEQLHELKKSIEDVDPDVRVGLNSRLAGARLAYLTRDREVSIFVRINKASLVAATSALAALSGARFLGNVFEKFWDSIKNLDKSAPRIAAISSGFITLAGVLGAAVSNMAGLAVSFAQLGQTAVLLPALLTGAGISIGVLIAAFKDMKTVLADLAPAFHNLQNTISAKFWEQAAQPIREMVNTLMPTLNEELGKLAASWGRLFAALSNEIKNNVTPEELTKMMGNLTRAVDIAARAMKPLVAAFNTLGSFGSEYLPRLSEWFVKLSDQFNNFIQGAAQDGSLNRWAEQGISAFKDLGRVIYQTVRVFAALSKAATVAGGSGFAQLAEGLRKLADTMNTANFQTTFITILASAHDVVDGLIEGLNNLGPGLASFAPTIARVFDQVGKVLARVGEDISTLLSVPELQSGIERMFSGLLTFVADLQPAMQPLGQIIGTLADIIGTLLSNFGLLLSAVAPYLATFFTDVWNAVKPLIPTLTDLVIALLPPLAEILTVLAREVLPPAVDLIKKLAPGFADLVKYITPEVVDLLKGFAEQVKIFNDSISATDVMTFVQGIKDATTAIENFLNIASSPQKTFEFFNSEPIKKFNDDVNQAIEDFWTSVNNWIVNLNTTVNQAFADFWGGLGSSIADGWSVITGLFNLGWTTVVNTYQGFQASLGASWNAFWNGLPQWVQDAWNNITATVISFSHTVTANIVGFIAGVINNWSTFWNNVWSTATQWTGQVLGNIVSWLGELAGNIVRGVGDMLTGWGDGLRNIWNSAVSWFNDIVQAVRDGIGNAVREAQSIPGKILGAIQGFAQDFINAGASLINNFAAGISGAVGGAIGAVQDVINAVADFLPGSPAKRGPLSGRGYTLLRGQRMVEGFAEGMKARTGAVQSASFGVASAVQFNSGTAPVTSVGSVAGGAASLVTIEGDYYGATPEQVADEFDKKVRRANTVHQITKVMK